MKKKFLISALIVSVSLLGVISLNAANNRVQIVRESAGAKQVSDDGAKIINRINTATSDLVNGEINIEILLDNSKNTEVIYAIDNGTTIASNKSKVIDLIKAESNKLSLMQNMKQGSVINTTSNQIVSSLPESTGIETTLESLKTTAAGTDGGIFDAIDKAAQNFSSNAENKTIVVFIGSLGTTDASTLKAKIDGHKANGINIIVYGINITDATNFANIFGNVQSENISNISSTTSIPYASLVAADLPGAMQDVNLTIEFDKVLLDNFDIKNLTTEVGTKSFDATTRKITWTPENIGVNQTALLTYTLSLKSGIDETIVDKLDIDTNRQIKVNLRQSGTIFNDSYPDDGREDIDKDCKPAIRILKEAVDNPKTGIANYMIAGICMIAVGSITLLLLNRKNQFNRI